MFNAARLAAAAAARAAAAAAGAGAGQVLNTGVTTAGITPVGTAGTGLLSGLTQAPAPPGTRPLWVRAVDTVVTKRKATQPEVTQPGHAQLELSDEELKLAKELLAQGVISNDLTRFMGQSPGQGVRAESTRKETIQLKGQQVTVGVLGKLAGRAGADVPIRLDGAENGVRVDLGPAGPTTLIALDSLLKDGYFDTMYDTLGQMAKGSTGSNCVDFVGALAQKTGLMAEPFPAFTTPGEAAEKLQGKKLPVERPRED